MPTYIIFSLVAAFSFALQGLFTKFVSKHKIANNWTLLFWQYLTFFPFILFYPLIFKISLPTSGWGFMFLNCLFFFLGNVFFTKAIYKLDASSFAPFFQLQAAFIAILAFAFLGERFPATNYLFILVMLAGSVLVCFDEKMNVKVYFQLATFWIISQQFFHAISNLFGGFALKTMDSFTFMFWTNLISLAFPLMMIPLVGIKKLRVPPAALKPFFVASFFSAIGATAIFTAFQTNLTISSALSLLTSPIVFLFSLLASLFWPKLLEHHTRKVYVVRGLGVLLILMAAIKLSLG